MAGKDTPKAAAANEEHRTSPTARLVQMIPYDVKQYDL